MILLDRIRFYYFHKQNLTKYSILLLSSVNTLAVEQGSFSQDLINGCSIELCTWYNNLFINILSSANLKENYAAAYIYERNENGLGFFANNLDFFFYELPFIILVYLLMLIIFKLLKKLTIAKYFKKYSFYCVGFLILYEGNV